MIPLPRARRLHFVVAPFVVLANCEDCVAVQTLAGWDDRLLRFRRRKWRHVTVESSARALVLWSCTVSRWAVWPFFLVERITKGCNLEAFVVLGNLQALVSLTVAG